jgi:hypothetical protein
MNRFIKTVLLILVVCHNSFAQKDNSLKVTASLTGLGASYELNPAKVLYVQAGVSTAFTVTRFNLQSKLSLFSNEKFNIKFGVEAAYIYGTFMVGGINIDYYKYPSFLFMPLLSLEGKVVGIEIPVILDRNLDSFFPIIGITLNVSKDKPANRVPRKKKKKNKE